MTTATESPVHASSYTRNFYGEEIKPQVRVIINARSYEYLTPAQARELISEIETALEEIKE